MNLLSTGIIAVLLPAIQAWAATPNPLPGSSDVIVRDPAIAYNPDNQKYYVFSTDDKIKIFTSSALTGPWTRSGSVLSADCSIIDHPQKCNPWAPDVSLYDGRWTLYYAVSEISTQNSAIGVAVSDSMDAGTWTDLGEVVRSKDGDASNAIDANLYDDEGKLTLTYGSWSGGIYQLVLSDIQNTSSAYPGTHLAGGNKRPAEGPFLYKPQSSEYYFLFFSYGITPLQNDDPRPAPGTEYRVLVGRSTSPSGPFLDANGISLTEDGAGTLVLGSHDNVYAPGGQSVFYDPASKRDVMVYHYVEEDVLGGPSYMGINYLDFGGGWPVVVE